MTFLFTDIEGSTRRWESDPDAMRLALAAHDGVLRNAIESRDGWLFKHTGDGVCAVFSSARAAADAAVDAQRSLVLPVRIGIATGEAELRGDDYFGPTLNRAARIMAAGHGGQILVALSTVALVDGLEWVDLGPRRLRDLSEPVQIFQVRAEGLRVEFPALNTIDTVRGNLPAQVTSFVGRESAVAAIVEALGGHRLVTLVGVGGVGKTRLALHTAAHVVGGYRDGAWLVELATVLDASVLVEAVAAVFTVQPQPGRSWRDGLIETLGGRELLLVLDNCEHVLDGVVPLVEAVLASCTGVVILATSREALGIRAERAWPVPSLDLGIHSAASALFVERARAVAPEYEPSESDGAVIAEICQRLDGIPLAIELAAARVRSMSPAQIRDRLDERFRLLTGSRRSIERHQTLRQAVQWSFDLLTKIEQRVLQRTSVFAGGFTLVAATGVCGPDADGDLDEFEMLDVLDSLVRKSLLHVDRSRAELRYGMLETIRQFAEEHLGANGGGDNVRDRHASWFADQSEAAFRLFLSPAEAQAFEFVDAEMANVQAAFRWAVDHGLVDEAIRIAAHAHVPARRRLRTETYAWAAEVVDAARGIEHRKLPLLLSMACNSARSLGQYEEAKRYGHEVLALADDGRYDPFVWAYVDLGLIALFEGDIEGGLTFMRAGAAHPADRHDRHNLAYLHGHSEFVSRHLPQQEVDDAVALIVATGIPTIVSWGLWAQSLAAATHDPTLSIALLRQAIDAAGAVGDRVTEQVVRGSQLSLLARAGDPEQALAGFVDLVSAWQINGDTTLGVGIGNLVLTLGRLGYLDGATRLYGTISRGAAMNWMVPGLDETLSTIRAAVGDSAFDVVRADGAALTNRAAGELAQQLISQARRDLASIAGRGHDG